MYEEYNPNPKGKRVGDCTVRAISKALEQDWNHTYIGLAVQGYLDKDMPSANAVWGSYLKRHGFRQHLASDVCPDCETVEDFCRAMPNGTYILALSSHVVCVKDGCVCDSWDSTKEVPIFFWAKEE